METALSADMINSTEIELGFFFKITLNFKNYIESRMPLVIFFKQPEHLAQLGVPSGKPALKDSAIANRIQALRFYCTV